MEVLTGILLGLSTLIFIGPVFFYLLKSTLEHSLRAGIAVAIGIIIGDILYVLIVFNGFSSIFEDQENKKWLALIGSIFLIAMGIKYLLKYSPTMDFSIKSSRSMITYAFNGFLINFINPFVIGVWILFVGINKSRFDTHISIITSLTFTLIVIFLTDCAKAIFAHKLKKLFNTNRLQSMFKIFGVIMIIFGIRLLLLFIDRF